MQRKTLLGAGTQCKYLFLKEKDFMRVVMVILEVSPMAAFLPNAVQVVF